MEISILRNHHFIQEYVYSIRSFWIKQSVFCTLFKNVCTFKKKISHAMFMAILWEKIVVSPIFILGEPKEFFLKFWPKGMEYYLIKHLK